MKTRPRLLERAFWNLHSRNWDDLLQDPDSARHVAEVAALLPAATAPRAVVADLGCGTGNHAAAMARDGLRVIGVDFTVAMLERVATKGSGHDSPPCLVRADLNQPLPFADSSLDGVLSVYSIQFLDASRFLSELHRVLKPGGTAVIEAPRHDPTPRDTSSLPLRYRAFRAFKNVVATIGQRVGLVQSYDQAELSTAVEAAGLLVTDLDATRHSVIAHLERT